MQEYLLLIHGKGYKDESPESLKKYIEEYQNWVNKLLKEDKYISGNRLANYGNVIVNGNTIVTDGPFLESKEIVGGYILIKAANIQDATKMAMDCPLSKELPISIRPMYQWPEL